MELTGDGTARRTVVVTHPDGLHARPAALFVRAAASSAAAVSIAKEGSAPTDAKSILGVLSLDVRKDDVTELFAQGDNAEQVLDTLAGLLTAPADNG